MTTTVDMPSLIAAIRSTDDCLVLPPCGTPRVAEGHVLPEDVKEFYGLCGGAKLFESSAFGITIVPPDRMVVANPVILIGVTEEQLEESRGHPSWSWHIIGEGPNAQYVTIDLAPERLGVCYNSFWDVHPGNSEVIARSFTEFLIRLLTHGGDSLQWDDPSFDLSHPPELDLTSQDR